MKKRAAEEAAVVARAAEEKEVVEKHEQEDQKKVRDSERKQQGEEEKRAHDAAVATAVAGATAQDENMPDADINDHLNDMMNGGVEGEGDSTKAMVAVVNLDFEMGVGDRESSLPKKRKKKDNKKMSKDSGEDSILRKGRFSKEAMGEKKKKDEEKMSRVERAAEAARVRAREEEEKKEMRKNHIHSFRRNLVE